MPQDEMVGARMSDYSPESIREVAELLAPQAGNYVNAITNQIGQAQRSIGPLASNAMGETTEGLGNYTYNRLVRPQVNTMRDEILVKGYTEQLNKMLSNALQNAQKRYASGGGSSSSSSSSSSGVNLPPEFEDTGASSGGYVHTGTMDEETGLWRDTDPSSMTELSGESGNIPIVDFFGWVGDTLSGKGAHREALKQMWPRESGYSYNDDGNTYWVYYGDDLITTGNL